MFLDGDGRAVVTSDGPKGNIGFPAAPHELAYFRTSQSLGTCGKVFQSVGVAIPPTIREI